MFWGENVLKFELNTFFLVHRILLERQEKEII